MLWSRRYGPVDRPAQSITAVSDTHLDVYKRQGEYDSQWATICSIAPKMGGTPETLRVWVRQQERDTGGGDGGLTTAEPVSYTHLLSANI